MPKWDVWKHVPILNATEAVSLTLNIEPHSVYEWSKGKWVYNIGKKSGMCTSIEGFADRLFLFKKCFGVNGKISLIQLANWSQSVGWNIPIELAAITPVEPKEILKTMSAEKAMVITARVINSTDIEGLASLFDPVPVESLEKMFPSSGKWKRWAGKTKTTGLICARVARAKFNPYLAGVWFIRKGIEGWDESRLNRVLANNLPERSRDHKHLLTGNID